MAFTELFSGRQRSQRQCANNRKLSVRNKASVWKQFSLGFRVPFLCSFLLLIKFATCTHRMLQLCIRSVFSCRSIREVARNQTHRARVHTLRKKKKLRIRQKRQGKVDFEFSRNFSHLCWHHWTSATAILSLDCDGGRGRSQSDKRKGHDILRW